MKVTVNVDCTPEEARHFFGLPDVKPYQDEMLQAMMDKMNASMDQMDPEAMMKLWQPLMGGQMTSPMAGPLSETMQKNISQMQEFWTGILSQAMQQGETNKKK